MARSRDIRSNVYVGINDRRQGGWACMHAYGQKHNSHASVALVTNEAVEVKGQSSFTFHFIPTIQTVHLLKPV